MNIVDQQHAAQLITNKGKSFKFDAVECLINHLEEIDTSTVGLYLVADFTNPGHLIDAKNAHYIISENIPSPMGEFLSAVPSNEVAITLQKSKEGTVYNWENILIHFKNK